MEAGHPTEGEVNAAFDQTRCSPTRSTCRVRGARYRECHRRIHRCRQQRQPQSGWWKFDPVQPSGLTSTPIAPFDESGILYTIMYSAASPLLDVPESILRRTSIAIGKRFGCSAVLSGSAYAPSRFNSLATSV
jgi:hypothetical protein